MAKGQQGRPRYGSEKEEEFYKLALSITASLDSRLQKYCDAEDRAKSWVVRKAIDKFLTEQGY